MLTEVVVIIDELTCPNILRKDLKESREAFLNTKISDSEAKINDALIGPGASENSDQVVASTPPHGFNLGGQSCLLVL